MISFPVFILRVIKPAGGPLKKYDEGFQVSAEENGWKQTPILGSSPPPNLRSLYIRATW